MNSAAKGAATKEVDVEIALIIAVVLLGWGALAFGLGIVVGKAEDLERKCRPRNSRRWE